MYLCSIKDFEGYYADKNGNVYSTFKKGCRNKDNKLTRIAPTPLKYRYTKNGYARVYMRRTSTGKREDVYVHRLIASIFLANPAKLPTVNHLNGIRDDNRADNLEWCTQGDNVAYAMTYGGLTRNSKGQYCHK